MLKAKKQFQNEFDLANGTVEEKEATSEKAVSIELPALLFATMLPPPLDPHIKEVIKSAEIGAEAYLRKQINLKGLNPNPDISDVSLRMISTPLHAAAYSGEANCVELLLSAGANPLIQDTKGNTPLHLALKMVSLGQAGGSFKQERYRRLCHVLSNFGPAARAIENDEGDTPHTLALKALMGNAQYFAEKLDFSFVEELKFLYEPPKPDFLQEMLDWQQQLRKMIQETTNIDVIKKHLAEANFLYYARNYNDCTEYDTPLHLAAKLGRVDIIRAIFSRQADLLIKIVKKYDCLAWLKDKKGNTPLHIAAKFGHADCVRVLLSFSDNTKKAKNYKEELALDLTENPELQALLEPPEENCCCCIQ